MRKCFLAILCVMVFIVSVCSANSEEKNNTWTKIASFRVGNGEDEIPNQDEMGGGYISPRNFFFHNNFFYVFIGGTKLIKKISLDGKIITSISLDEYPYFASIYFDKNSNKIFGLAISEVYILSQDFKLLSIIDIFDIMKHEKAHFDNIEVYNDNLYLYLGTDSNLYIIDYMSCINKKVKYNKDNFVLLKGGIVKRINKNNYFASFRETDNKITIYDNNNKRKDIKIPGNVGFVSFRASMNQSLYLFGLSLKEGTTSYYELIKIDNNLNYKIIDLMDSDLIYGSSEPLLDIDKIGLYQLCLKNDNFKIYYKKDR